MKKGSAIPDTRSPLERLLDTHLPDGKIKSAAKELGVALPQMARARSILTPNAVTEAAVSVLGKKHRVTSPRLIGDALDWLVKRGVLVREGRNGYLLHRNHTDDPVGQQILDATPSRL